MFTLEHVNSIEKYMYVALSKADRFVVCVVAS